MAYLNGLGFVLKPVAAKKGTVTTVTEAQRKAAVSVAKNAAWYEGVAKVKERAAATAALSFDELEASVFMKDPNYAKFARLFSREERETFWVESGKPRHPIPVIQQMNKLKGKFTTIAERVEEAKQTIASNAMIQAAAQAVQAVQAANPQYSSQALIAAAARVTSAAAQKAADEAAETEATPLTADAAGGTVTGVATAGLAVAGLFLLKAAIGGA